MSITISNKIYYIIGMDKDNQVIQLLDEDGEDNKYIRIDGTIIWEGNPPTCNKCKKANITNQICTDKCYNFHAIKINEKKDVIKRYRKKKKEMKLKIEEEEQLIKASKKDGIVYKSKIFSQFTSEDNTEKMTFDL